MEVIFHFIKPYFSLKIKCGNSYTILKTKNPFMSQTTESVGTTTSIDLPFNFSYH
ncbi:hypothetical protein LEP1GSC088_1501 [Leptospira interrogans str. L1207]|nr:hypothetical protein LEP1GSC088_1501 [Leptospira interrogans str. L1207]